jgi:hypothetical protein
MATERFPVGGPRQPVYDYLTSLGFSMSKHSDKEWTSADGLTVNIFGTGSRARIGKDEFPLDSLAGYLRDLRSLVKTINRG